MCCLRLYICDKLLQKKLKHHSALYSNAFYSGLWQKILLILALKHNSEKKKKSYEESMEFSKHVEKSNENV